MSLFSSLLRSLRDLVARLFGRAAPTLPEAAARAALPDAAHAGEAASPPPPATTYAVSVEVPTAASSVAPAEPDVVVSVTPAPPELAAQVAVAQPARGEALVPDARPVLTVRRFFAQVAAAAPGGLTIDFSAWQGATVDRFFLALTAPERTRRRGPALGETVSLSGAFDGFEWD